MTLFRSKSLGEELIGRTQRIAGAGGNHPRAAIGAAREYTGQAYALARELIGSAGREVRRHPKLGIAIGTGLGLGAIAAAYLISRRQARFRDEHDEHDPTGPRLPERYDGAVEQAGDERPVAGESGLY